MDGMNTRDKINHLLKICPNYEKINSYEFFEGDTFSETMINFYIKLIDNIDMNSKEETDFLSNLDTALSKYVDNYKFRKFLKTKLVEIDTKEKYYTYKITVKLIEYSSTFDGTEIESTRWI